MWLVTLHVIPLKPGRVRRFAGYKDEDYSPLSSFPIKVGDTKVVFDT